MVIYYREKETNMESLLAGSPALEFNDFIPRNYLMNMHDLIIYLMNIYQCTCIFNSFIAIGRYLHQLGKVGKLFGTQIRPHIMWGLI